MFFGFFSIYSNTSFGHIHITSAFLANLAQRIFGLTLFTMLFVQIILGSFMRRLTEIFGGWIFKFHVLEGITIYSLVLLHITSFILFRYFAGLGLDPFYIFTDFCLLCKTKSELYITLGRLSFWLITTTVFAGLFRTLNPFMRIHWKKFHILNYLVFLLIGIHGFLLGTDFGYMPFFVFAIVAYVAVLVVIMVKSAKFIKNSKNHA